MVIGLTASDRELIVFGKDYGGYDANTLIYRYDGVSWRECSFSKPNPGRVPRYAWDKSQLYLVGADLFLYRLNGDEWIVVSQLPLEVVSRVGESKDMQRFNLTSYRGQIYFIFSNQIYSYTKNWKKEVEYKLPYITELAEVRRDKLIIAGTGCCNPGYFLTFDGS